MLSQTLFERKRLLSDPLVTKGLSLRGQLTRHLGGSFFKLSKKHYRFFCNGEFFAQFDIPPTHETNPSAVFYTASFTGGTDIKIDGEDYHQLNFGDVSIKLKFADNEEKRNWISAFGLFHSINLANQQYSEVEDPEWIPPLVRLRIMEELEVENWSKLRQDFDYSMFFQDKSLKSLLLETKLLKNRLLVGKIKFESKASRTSLSGEESPCRKSSIQMASRKIKEKESPLNDVNLVGFEFHIIILNQRPAYKLDEELFRTDYRILEDSNVPKWMDFGRVFFFSYNQFGDRSEFKHSLYALLFNKRPP